MVGQDELTARALAAIRDEALGCTRCPLSTTRTQVVFGDGPPRAALMVVGEAPGQDEDRVGRPFYGRSGRTLDRLLEKAGLARANVYIANVVMSRPPNDRDPRADEIEACGPYLEIQRQLVGPRVIIGKNVRIGASTVIGHPGFGWAFRGTETRAIPQLGGVIIDDDVVVGPLSTIDAGTLGPTRIRRGAKLDAQVHVGHNCDIGEHTIVAAQTGFAGSVIVGRGVLVGGQAGFADHVSIGDGARIAAKSGVIGDVPAGATVAGYPAVPRIRWLRALARLYRGRIEPPPE